MTYRGDCCRKSQFRQCLELIYCDKGVQSSSLSYMDHPSLKKFLPAHHMTQKNLFHSHQNFPKSQIIGEIVSKMVYLHANRELWDTR